MKELPVSRSSTGPKPVSLGRVTVCDCVCLCMTVRVAGQFHIYLNFNPFQSLSFKLLCSEPRDPTPPSTTSKAPAYTLLHSAQASSLFLQTDPLTCRRNWHSPASPVKPGTWLHQQTAGQGQRAGGYQVPQRPHLQEHQQSRGELQEDGERDQRPLPGVRGPQTLRYPPSDVGQYLDALEKAKEVTNREKALRKQRENSNTADLINVELSFAVALNHALCL